MTDACARQQASFRDVRTGTGKVVLALVVAIIVAGCGPDQANRSLSAQPVAVSARTDVSQPALVAGLQAMQGRILRKVSGFTDIVPTATSRYFMHPGMDKDAVMEIDVSNLSSLTLSPRISELQEGCLGDAEAGVVEFTYAVDEDKPTRILVDRNYDKLLVIELAGSKRLAVAANNGNGVTTCDWFGLGFLNVRAVQRAGQ